MSNYLSNIYAVCVVALVCHFLTNESYLRSIVHYFRYSNQPAAEDVSEECEGCAAAASEDGGRHPARARTRGPRRNRGDRHQVSLSIISII